MALKHVSHGEISHIGKIINHVNHELGIYHLIPTPLTSLKFASIGFVIFVFYAGFMRFKMSDRQLSVAK